MRFQTFDLLSEFLLLFFLYILILSDLEDSNLDIKHQNISFDLEV